MNDRTTKALLAAIALGLWANAAVTAIRPAVADYGDSATLHQIQEDVSRISGGRCWNQKLC